MKINDTWFDGRAAWRSCFAVCLLLVIFPSAVLAETPLLPGTLTYKQSDAELAAMKSAMIGMGYTNVETVATITHNNVGYFICLQRVEVMSLRGDGERPVIVKERRTVDQFCFFLDTGDPARSDQDAEKMVQTLPDAIFETHDWDSPEYRKQIADWARKTKAKMNGLDIQIATSMNSVNSKTAAGSFCGGFWSRTAWHRGPRICQLDINYTYSADTDGDLEAARSAFEKHMAEAASRLDSAVFKTARSAELATNAVGRIPDDTVPAHPVTAEQINKLLNLFCGQLQVAAETPQSSSAYFWVKKKITGDYSAMDWGQAADLALSVWEQTATLQRIVNRHGFPTTDEQKNRMHAMGHWTAWIIKRGRKNPAYNAAQEPPSTAPVSDAEWPKKIAREYVLGDYRTTARGEPPVWVPFPSPPPYSLFGKIGEVPPPPLKVIFGEDDDIYNEEYGRAVFWTAAQGADAYFTWGLIFTAHAVIQQKDLKLLGIATLSSVPKYGPPFAFLVAGIQEACNFDVYTWDQHAANLCAMANLGLAGATRCTRPKELGDPKKPVFEGGVPEKVKAAVGADASYVLEPIPGGDRAKIKTAVPGVLEGKQKMSDPCVPIEHEVKVVNHNGEKRFFLPDGEPIIPINDKGYHALSHLLERKAGYATGEVSLKRAFQGTKFEKRIDDLVKGLYEPHADRIRLSEEYVQLMDDVVADYRQTGICGYFSNVDAIYAHYGKVWEIATLKKFLFREPPEANYFVTIKNGNNEIHTLRVVFSKDSKFINAYIQNPGTKPNITRLGIHNRFYESVYLRPFLEQK